MEDKFQDFTLKIPLFAGVGVVVKKGQEIKEGQVVARMEQEGGKQPVEIKSPVKAKVIDLEKNFLVLQFPALVFSVQDAFGISGWGELKLFSGQLFELREVERRIVLLTRLTSAILNKLEALDAVGAVCLEMDKRVEQDADEIGILVLAEKDYKRACQQEGNRAKVDVGDRRLIVAK